MLSFKTSTFLEIIAVTLSVAYIIFAARFIYDPTVSMDMSAPQLWLYNSGDCFVFGVLIYVIAHGNGAISKFLSSPVLVFFGEISFSLYLVHVLFLIWYRDNLGLLAHYPNLVSLSFFLCILFLASYLMWALVELPVGGFLRKILGTRRNSPATTRTPVTLRALTLPVLGLTAFSAMIALTENGRKVSTVNIDVAQAITPTSQTTHLGKELGPWHVLAGLRAFESEDGLEIDSGIQKTDDYRDDVYLLIQVLSDDDTLVDRFAAPLPDTGIRWDIGSVWQTGAKIPLNAQNTGYDRIRVGLWDSTNGYAFVEVARENLIDRANAPSN